jgi:acyl-CoA dehydrogenase
MWLERVAEVGPRFADRAAEYDAGDRFIAENYGDLKRAQLFSAGVPAELGGGGATHTELCEMLRALAGYCGSTALALSMHTHLIATAAWRWRNDKGATEPLLRQVAREELVLVSSGGSDWLASSGKAERVDGGYRVTARKVFSSGSPAGQLLMTSAILDDPDAGPTVLHFPVSLGDQAVRMVETWRTLGMRGTGSNDLELEGVTIPESAITGRRAAGQWHPMLHLASIMALPLIYSVYCGLAERARTLAVSAAARRRDEPASALLVGELENQLTVARLGLAHMMQVAAERSPSPETTNEILICRTLVGQAAIRTVEKAMEVAGGAAFYRAFGLERLFRDVQAARYHPLQEKAQLAYTGRLALGLDING